MELVKVDIEEVLADPPGRPKHRSVDFSVDELLIDSPCIPKIKM